MTLSVKWPRLRAQAKCQERTQIEKMGYGDSSQPRISCRAMLMVSLEIAYAPGHCVVLNACRIRANPEMGVQDEFQPTRLV